MLILKNINKRYDRRKIISSFSYYFIKGKMYFLCSNTGSGKTTLLNIIAQVDLNYAGMIIYNNQNIKEDKSFSINKISYIFQEHFLFEELSVLENLKMVNEDLKIINKYAKELEIHHLLKQKVKFLSGGEKQRVNILRAIIKPSEIILADEPTSSLNQDLALKVYKILDKLKKDKIIIVVTHQNEYAKQFNDEIFSLQENKIINYNLKRTNISLSKINYLDTYKKYKKIHTCNQVFMYLTYFVLSLSMFITGFSFLISNSIDRMINNQFNMIDGKNNVVCSSLDYYTEFKIDINYQYKIIDNYIITPNPELLLEYLLNQENLTNYSFTLIDNKIEFNKIENKRIPINYLNKFYNLNEGNIIDYIYSDNENIYIDKSTGMIFLVGINRLSSSNLDYKIDDVNKVIRFSFYNKVLDSRCIGISKSLAEKLNLNINQNIYLSFFNKTFEYKVVDIVNDNNLSYIYGNKNIMDGLINDKYSNIYNAVFLCKNKQLINNTSKIMINDNLFSFNDYSFSKEISYIILFYSFVLLLFSFFVVSLNFKILILKNRKNIIILKKLGIPEKQQIFIMLIKPYSQIIKISFLTLFQLLFSNFLLCFFINKELDININFAFPYIEILCMIFSFLIIFITYFYIKTKKSIFF